MNYKKHYDAIIERSKTRQLDGYVEIHHIIPSCMNGTNDKENLAVLTAREHFVSHQLLVKIFPNEYGLVKAANMMCNGHDGNRINNRLYEWLRKRLSIVMSKSQSGEGNSQYGKHWVINPKNDVIQRVTKDELQSYLDCGWFNGKTYQNCNRCNAPYKNHHAANCSSCSIINRAENGSRNLKELARTGKNTEASRNGTRKNKYSQYVTPAGTFKTAAEAAGPNNVHMTTILYRCKNNWVGWSRE